MQKLILGTLAAAGISASSAMADATLDEIRRQCGLQLKLSERGCSCIVERADDELNDSQRRFVVAKVTRDQAAERDLSLSRAEMQEVTAFIQSAPRDCAP